MPLRLLGAGSCAFPSLLLFLSYVAHLAGGQSQRVCVLQRPLAPHRMQRAAWGHHHPRCPHGSPQQSLLLHRQRGALGMVLSTSKSTEMGSSSPVPCLGPSIGKGLGVGSASSQLLVTLSKNRPHHQHWPTAARPRCLGHCPSRLSQNLLSQAGQPPGALLSSQVSSAPTNKTEPGTPKPSSLRAHKPRQRLWHPSCT